ncbi:MAG: hypothetical protein H6Q13_1475 [Bacteroidetes bacterium]|nr:hypothetical protein [Bacteroidota bacterium]
MIRNQFYRQYLLTYLWRYNIHSSFQPDYLSCLFEISNLVTRRTIIGKHYINDRIAKNPPQTLLPKEDYKQNKQIKP